MERILCDDGTELWPSDSPTDAGGLQLAITTADFLSALVITNSCLKCLQALMSNLQVSLQMYGVQERKRHPKKLEMPVLHEK